MHRRDCSRGDGNDLWLTPVSYLDYLACLLPRALPNYCKSKDKEVVPIAATAVAAMHEEEARITLCFSSATPWLEIIASFCSLYYDKFAMENVPIFPEYKQDMWRLFSETYFQRDLETDAQ